jgi:phenylacetate-coenzyme A ligase PaaK-like adenylate-forming protein
MTLPAAIGPAVSPHGPVAASLLAWDTLLARWGDEGAIEARRERRLAALFAAARRCAFYRERFARHGERLADQPPVHKAELMERFADWVGDPRLQLDRLRDFATDPARVGQPFAGMYTVWHSSGSSGVPGLFVQDPHAMAVYDALEAQRRPVVAAWRRWMDPFYLGERIAFVGATGGHFASIVSVERLRRTVPTLGSRLRAFSFLQPAAELTVALNDWRPSVIATYPSTALVLAEEARASRLRIAPCEIWTGGEALSEATRRHVAQAFGCPVQNSYGASEFLALAAECSHRRLHLNDDWAILEPVDEHGVPVPRGQTGCTTLLTNLANHVQPLIRYDLGDRVRISATRCACGSPLPVIEVEGRVDDMLQFGAADGRVIRLSSLALTTVLEDEASVFDFQLAQDGGAPGLTLTLAPGERDDAPDPAVPERARSALHRYLSQQGLAGLPLRVQRGALPGCSASGKRPRVVASAGLPLPPLARIAADARPAAHQSL